MVAVATIARLDTRVVLFTPEGHESRIGQFQAMSFWTGREFVYAGVEVALRAWREKLRCVA